MIAIIAIVASVIAESFIFYAIAELFATGYSRQNSAIPAVGFILIGLTAYSLPGAASFFNLRGKAAFAMLVVVAYAVVYGVLRVEFAGDLKLWDVGWVFDFLNNEPTSRDLAGPILLSSMLVAGTWARASYRANSEVDLETLPRTLAAGFGMATLLVLLGAPSERVGEVARGAAGFYAFGVLALAMSQLAMSGATIGDARAGGVTGMLLGGIVGVTAVSVLIFGLVFGVIGPIIGPPLSDAIGFIFALILTPPAWLISKIINFLLGGQGFPEITMQGLQGATEANGEKDDPSTAQKTLAFGARSLAFLLFLVLVGGPILLFWALRKRSSRAREVDAMASGSGSVMDDLRSLLRGFGRKRGEQRNRSEDHVGRLYRDVLDEAEHEGRQRQPSETPREFAPVLADKFHTQVTDDITQVFVDARYAGREVPEGELERLEAEWRERKRLREK